MENVFILTSRCGCEINKPSVFTSLSSAQNIMKLNYDNAVEEMKGNTDCDFEHRIEDVYAMVDTGSDWIEWYITECNINN